MEAATTPIGMALKTKNGATLQFFQNDSDGNVEVHVNEELFLQSLKGFGLNAGTTRVVMIGTKVAQTSMEHPVEGFKVWLDFKTKKSATGCDERLRKAGVSRVQFTPYKDEK